MHIRMITLTGLAMALISGNVLAETVVVTATVTKFEPTVVFVKPGDTVKWSNMAAHDTVSLPGMIPDGAQAWQSKMGEDFSVTLDAPRVYIYKCNPHVSLGMVGAIVVGEGKPANLAAVKSSPENKGMIARAIRELDKALQAKGF